MAWRITQPAVRREPPAPRRARRPGSGAGGRHERRACAPTERPKHPWRPLLSLPRIQRSLAPPAAPLQHVHMRALLIVIGLVILGA
ncbi:MAG: hypothetical protein VYD05_13660, partial [Planctomycetota bacterium]|nr:hypothetical protein [Planctomycetota bacterium]